MPVSSASPPPPVPARHTEPAPGSNRGHRPSFLRRVWNEWRRFRYDQPGRRFRNYRAHLHRHASGGVRACCLFGGLVLTAAGVAMCFLPGPGVPVLFLGFAMFAGESRTLARWLDRLEPALRRRVADVQRWWRRLPFLARAVCVVLIIIATGAAMRAWWAVFGP